MKRPFSARPRLCVLPRRLTEEQRKVRLARIERCSYKNESGCWLYPYVRNFLDPYVDIVNDEGKREQWTMRRYVWALTQGDIPPGAIVVRRCKSRRCVAPGHPTLWHQADWVGHDDADRRLCHKLLFINQSNELKDKEVSGGLCFEPSPIDSRGDA